MGMKMKGNENRDVEKMDTRMRYWIGNGNGMGMGIISRECEGI